MTSPQVSPPTPQRVIGLVIEREMRWNGNPFTIGREFADSILAALGAAGYRIGRSGEFWPAMRKRYEETSVHDLNSPSGVEQRADCLFPGCNCLEDCDPDAAEEAIASGEEQKEDDDGHSSAMAPGGVDSGLANPISDISEIPVEAATALETMDANLAAAERRTARYAEQIETMGREVERLQKKLEAERRLAANIVGQYERADTAAQERITRLTGALEKIADETIHIQAREIARAALAGRGE